MMVEVQNLSFAYKKRVVLENISFTLSKGEILVILGPNGGGKSTLLKLMANILPIEHGCILLENKLLSLYKRRELALKLAFVQQQNSVLFPFTVKETVAMGQYSHSRKEESILYDILDKTGLTPLKDRLITTLSGGEQQRVFVAQALAQKSELILLDEATSNLDINHTHEILSLLKEEVRRENITVVAVIHDINTALTFANKIMFLSKERQTQPALPREAINQQNLTSFYNINPCSFSLDQGVQLQFGEVK